MNCFAYLFHSLRSSLNPGHSTLRHTLVRVTVLSLLIGVFALPAAAAPAAPFPEVIPLPNGFQPEGIASGRGTSFYTGSLQGLQAGSIFKGDYRTGAGSILVPPQTNRMAIGMKVDLRTNYLFVAGGLYGTTNIYDAATGADVATYQLTTEPVTAINDVIITRDAAYFTDSFRPYLYRLPLGPGGSLPDPSAVEEIALSGDYTFIPGPFVFNSNGIEATADGRWLILVNTAAQALYKVDPNTGVATTIDLGGPLPNGDGLLLNGRTLYVVQNFLNQIAVIDLAPGLGSGTIVETITSPYFRIPATIARFGSALYAVNARFDVPAPDPTTEYEVVRVSR
jgi:hypothetical protein